MHSVPTALKVHKHEIFFWKKPNLHVLEGPVTQDFKKPYSIWPR